MKKIIHLEPYFPTGELTIQPVMLWSRNKSFIEPITKHASVGSDFFKTIQPVPGHSIVYVLAVSSWEAYAENKNGDGFPEFPYMESAKPPWIAADETLTHHYKSFETHGHNYRHHVNKDPKKAVGKVMKAFWNPPMHRVELLIDLEDAKAPDLAERIAAGEFPPVSMGTRVKYDVCNICGNRAPTRAQYCDHLKYQMREILPDGRKVCALNPSPKFFDISWVFKPADINAYMMKKVAEPVAYDLLSGAAAGEYIDKMEDLKTASHKLAVMDKVVQGLPVDARTENIDETELDNMVKMRSAILNAGHNTPDLPDDLLKNLAGFKLSKILSTMFSGGMMLNTPEFVKVVMYKTHPKMEVSDDILDKSVLMQRPIMELFEEHPQLLDQLELDEHLGLAPENVDVKVAELLDPYFEKRSAISDYLSRRFVPEAYQDPHKGRATSLLTLTDPATNATYGTTRGAAIRAHDEIAKRNLYKILGGTALLGGAYKVIGNNLTKRGLGKMKPLVGLTMGALGLTQYPSMGEHYMTEQGIPIPTMTELTPLKYASAGWAMPLFGTLGTMALLGHDYTSRLRRGVPVGHPALPLSRQLLDHVERISHEHPLLTAAGGTLLSRRIAGGPTAKFLGKNVGQPAMHYGRKAYGYARQVLKDFADGVKVSSWLEKELPRPTGTVMLPEINTDQLAEKIGEIIVEG